MEGNFGTAFMLLLVGMITVFSVLFFVVLLGKALIRLVNALHKEIPVATEPFVASGRPRFLFTKNEIYEFREK